MLANADFDQVVRRDRPHHRPRGFRRHGRRSILTPIIRDPRIPVTSLILFSLVPLLMAPQCGSMNSSPCAESPAETLAFRVTGDCGAEGDVTITSIAGSCSGTLQGGHEVGLPEIMSRSQTETHSFTGAGWEVRGERPGSTGLVVCRAQASDSDFMLECMQESEAVCDAVLSPES